MKKTLFTVLTLAAVNVISSAEVKSQQMISTQDNGLGLMVAEDPQAQNGLHLYRVDRSGKATLLHENIFPESGLNTFSASKSIVDEASGKVYLLQPPQGGVQKYRIYNAFTNKFEGYTTIEGVPDNSQPSFLKIPFGIQNVVDKNCVSNDGTTCASESVVSLGGSGDDSIAVIDKEGLKVGGKSVVSRKVNAAGEEELHIGENSLVTVESNGIQKLYATDANGKKIPINVTEGSDLQINGVSVQGQIDTNAVNINNNSTAINNNSKKIDDLEDNVTDLGFGVAGATALSTAMSALPTVAQDSPLSCGVGTGGYSSRFAMSIGCAVKANDRLSINAGGSYVFGGAADYGNGSLSTAAARAGFVFKFGNLDTPSASNEQLQSQLNDVQEENASIKEQNQELLARLERLEAIALGNQPSAATASLK